MTIHKAKGLDFEHTYVVQLHKQPGAAGSEPDTVAPEALDGHDEGVLFGAPTLGRHRIRARGERVEAAERVRTLYVAATRAKRRLVLLGCWPETEPDPPPDPEHAKSHVDLLASRRGGRPDLESCMREARDEGRLHHDDPDGVRWVFPGLRAAEAVQAPAGAGEAGAGADAPSEPDQRLARRRAEAAATMARPYRAAASADGHAGEREAETLRRFGEAGEGGARFGEAAEGAKPFAAAGVAREAARAAGTAVHRILEDLDLEAGPQAALTEQRGRLPALVAGLADEAAREPAVAQAERILDALAAGGEDGLLARLRGLRERVVARELDVLLAPGSGAEGAVGFVAGAVDLVYRDPADERLVVVDYKTDAVAGESELDEKVARYRSQGRVYQRALEQALALDYEPRFELWFLAAGRVVPVA
jgi:ATP-dependent exoDNAse (exonuclease V) beta subunit